MLSVDSMLDMLAALVVTVWVAVLLWQVVRGAVSERSLSRLLDNPKLVTGYRQTARAVMVGSIGLAIMAGFLWVLFLQKSPGVTLWYGWSVAALTAGALLLSRRLVQVAMAAEKVGSPGRRHAN
jgi:hypothetical protein